MGLWWKRKELDRWNGGWDDGLSDWIPQRMGCRNDSHPSICETYPLFLSAKYHPKKWNMDWEINTIESLLSVHISGFSDQMHIFCSYIPIFIDLDRIPIFEDRIISQFPWNSHVLRVSLWALQRGPLQRGPWFHVASNSFLDHQGVPKENQWLLCFHRGYLWILIIYHTNHPFFF